MPRAQRKCPVDGCRNLIRSPQKRCDEHSGWSMSPRTASAASTGNRRFREQVRMPVLQRDQFRCQIRDRGCLGPNGEQLQADQLQADHIIEVSDGGTDDMGNMQTACIRCHRRKTGRHASNTRHHGHGRAFDPSLSKPPTPPRPQKTMGRIISPNEIRPAIDMGGT